MSKIAKRVLIVVGAVMLLLVALALYCRSNVSKSLKMFGAS